MIWERVGRGIVVALFTLLAISIALSHAHAPWHEGQALRVALLAIVCFATGFWLRRFADVVLFSKWTIWQKVLGFVVVVGLAFATDFGFDAIGRMIVQVKQSVTTGPWLLGCATEYLLKLTRRKPFELASDIRLPRSSP